MVFSIFQYYLKMTLLTLFLVIIDEKYENDYLKQLKPNSIN